MKEEILKNKETRAKKMMLLFALLSITMTFGGLTSAYVVSKGRPDWLEDLILPISFTYSTFILFLSSFTIHLSKFFLKKPNGKSNSLKFLILTFIYIPLFKYFIELNNNDGHTFMTADWLINSYLYFRNSIFVFSV